LCHPDLNEGCPECLKRCLHERALTLRDRQRCDRCEWLKTCLKLISIDLALAVTCLSFSMLQYVDIGSVIRPADDELLDLVVDQIQVIGQGWRSIIYRDEPYPPR
jgi:hypothetical protein